ncbi:MAG: hypothetical protein IPJ69_08450 [Deltaproteobacteria bacterium]|nr:MAG: hypothetical protein IPJ69_08450 [Deltaproteobacteria bacterium]
MKRKSKVKGGFKYYRTKAQIIEYINTPPEEKLRWLEEMREFNNLLARSNPMIGKIQEKFRQGDI